MVKVTAIFRDENMPKVMIECANIQIALSEVQSVANRLAALKAIWLDNDSGRHVYNGRGEYLFTIPAEVVKVFTDLSQENE